MQFHVFKQNTDATATNKGFYYQYLKTVKLWLENYINGIENDIYCEYEDDIFEHNDITQTYNFRQIKCYSTDVGLNSEHIKSSLLNFYKLFEKYDYKGEFYFESNSTFKSSVGKSLKNWYKQQQRGNFSVDNYIDETRKVLKGSIETKLESYLKKKLTKEEKKKAKDLANEFYQTLQESSFKTFLESIRWDFSEELDTDKAVELLSSEVLTLITSDDLHYDNRVDKKLLFGCLVNSVIDKSIKDDKNERLLTNNFLQEILNLTEIDTSSFNDELKELINRLAEKNLTIKSSNNDNNFVGREKELKDIDKQLESSTPVLLLKGIGGMGKSSLANYYLYTRESKYDYYGFIDGLDSFISEFENSLDLRSEKENKSLLYKEIIYKLRQRKGKKLLVIDNIQNITDNKKLIEMILSLTKDDYKILLTSRNKIKDVNFYFIGTLFLEDARGLFLRFFETKEIDKVDEIICSFGLHTLFIKLVAETMNSEGYTLDDIIKKFKDENGGLSKIEFIDEESGDEVTFNNNLQELFSMQNLKDDYVLLLKQLSILPSIDIEFAFLQKILNQKRKGRLNFLGGRGWLIENGKYYKLHEIIKEFILANYTPSFGEIEGVFNFFQKSIDKDSYDIISDINQGNLSYYDSIYNYLIKFQITNKEIADYFSNISHLYNIQEQYEKAEKSLIKAIEIGDKLQCNISSYYHNLGSTYLKKEEYEKSKFNFKKSIEVEKKFDNEPYELAMSYNSLGKLYSEFKNYDFELAKKYYFEAFYAFDKYNLSSVSLEIAGVYNSLGTLYLQKAQRNKEDIERAEWCIKESLKIKEENLDKNHPSLVYTYLNLSKLYFDIKEIEEAIKYQKKAIEIQEKVLPKNHSDLKNSKEDLNLLRNILKISKIHSLK